MSWVQILPEAALAKKKEELSLDIVALFCLVSMTENTCILGMNFYLTGLEILGMNLCSTG